jgi:hypothetical protein
VVISVASCSSASAAKAASITSGPTTWSTSNKRRRIAQWRSPGSITPALGRASHDETILAASVADSGWANTLELVVIPINAHSVSQGKRTNSGPESACSLHGARPLDNRRTAVDSRRAGSPVRRSFELLKQLTHVVQVKPWPELTKLAWADPERFGSSRHVAAG